MAWIKYEIVDGKGVVCTSSELHRLTPKQFRDLMEEASADCECRLDAFNGEQE